jgi:hypothetical protein
MDDRLTNVQYPNRLPANTDWSKHPNGTPDFTKMTGPQRAAYDTARLTKKFG